MSDPLYLVVFDTDRVKDYVFATTDLKRIKGGSILLETLNKQDTPEMIRQICHAAGHPISDDQIVAGGGAATLIVPTPELASDVVTAVERLYRDLAIDGTITGISVEIQQKQLDVGFGERLADAAAKLRQAKDAKGLEPEVWLTPYLRPCDACGRHAATRMDPLESGKALCRSCWHKQDWNNLARDLFRQGFRDHVRDIDPEGADRWPDTSFPQDFEQIGITSRPSGYLGFILADGNQTGSRLFEMGSFTRYRQFASALDKLIRRVTYQALLNAFPTPRAKVAPFEMLLIGGDDLMLVTAADQAMEIAMEITELFSKESQSLIRDAGLVDPLTLSAAVVIAHTSFPIAAMHALAESLIQRAKRTSLETGEGSIDFMVVTEASTAGVDVEREAVLSHESFVVRPSPGEKYALTERPYTVDRLKKLVENVQELKRDGFPQSTLQAMYEAIFHSRTQAQIVSAQQLMQAKRRYRQSFLSFFDDLCVSRETMPWRDHELDKVSTPLGDLVEIYPFIGR